MRVAKNVEASCELARFDHWQHAVSEAFVPLEVKTTTCGGRAHFTGTLSTTSLGRLQLSEVGGQDVDVRRTPSTIKRADPGMIKVGLQLAGRGVLVQHEREAVLAPGDFAVYDTSEPYDLHFADSFTMSVLMFPRELLRLTPRALHAVSARRIRGGSGMGALVSSFLKNLHHAASLDTVASTPNFEDGVIDLVIAALNSEAPSLDADVGPSLLQAAKYFIDANLHDSTLDTATVAARHHVSVRHLQKLFQADGHTVAGWIRRRRLEKCRHDLADPQLRDAGIGTLCARNGLINSSHFSKLFREAYGISPRAYREQELLSVTA